MAAPLDISLRAKGCFYNSCTSFVLTDTTGEYDSSANDGGWGSPNWDVTDITAAEIEITYPDGTVQTVDVTSQVPSSYTGNFYFNYIVPTTGIKFEDGLYEIKYSVTVEDLGVSETYEYSFYKPALCSVTCCVNKQLAKLRTELCNTCDYDTYLYNMRYMETMLNSLMYASWCGRTSEFDYILTTLESLCDYSDCTDC